MRTWEKTYYIVECYDKNITKWYGTMSVILSSDKSITV